MAVVVDTDVVSFLYKKDSRAVLFRPHLLGQDLFVSFMTLAELDNWAARYNWGATRREDLERYLQNFIPLYSNRDLCRYWAQVSNETRRRGKPIEAADAWIAATAVALDIPLVTNNPDDFTAVKDLSLLTAKS
jgi:tRNA(fMet)-specific endonuclease VapC